MRKLLVPVDGSDSASRALRYALEMAGTPGSAKLLLVNVQSELERSYAHGLNSEAARAHLRELGEAATADARAALTRAGVLYDFVVAFGDPADVIARLARDEGCWCIVMGTRGLGGIESAFLGATSHKVLHLAAVPVVLVK
jgi:nucleotide-binding universal stress UspA family protein